MIKMLEGDCAGTYEESKMVDVMIGTHPSNDIVPWHRQPYIRP